MSQSTTAAPRLRTRKPGPDRRREIADAALRLVSAHGLGRFTTAALAAEVGVTDGALFRHFDTKEDIVLAAIDRVEEVLFAGFPPEAADPLERLGLFFRSRVDVIRDRPGISRVLVSDELAHAAPAEGVARVLGFRRRSEAFVRSCLAEAARDGVLAPGIHVDTALVLVLGAILALAHVPPAGRARAPAAASPERVWTTLETFLRGPLPRDPTADRRSPRRMERQHKENT
ncbi:MAG TPA: TetR/AcrR family transcriptional regulator [Anaeromyxobacteraceae bacterium]|nr:TetR/AcrR family transcriptional regulator [Anaeromyxobacteraceae bacterium]